MGNREKKERELSIGQLLKAVCREPHRVGQTDVDLVSVANERKRAKQRVAQAVGILLHRVADGRFSNTPAKIADDIGFAGRNDDAHSIHSGGEHALQQVLGNGTRSLPVSVTSRTHGQQFLRECQGLDTRTQTRGGNDSPSKAHAAASTNSISSCERCRAVCASRVRSRADLAMRRSSSGLRSSASITSSERRATKRSRPGSKNSSKPSHQSLTMGAAQAAASNSLPEGQYPTPAMAARVTFSVARQEE